MRSCLIFIFHLLFLTFCSSQITKDAYGRTTIKAPSVRGARVSGSSSRLSLINYRFNRRPRRKNLDVHDLKLMLGSEFNPRFMSIELPPGLGNQSVATYEVKLDSWKYGELVSQLQNISLAEELQKLGGAKSQIPSEYVKTFERWLLKKASCPVKYVWMDIGSLFWPRYIRLGECAAGASSCSWPSGMHCVASSTSNITILRWQCKNPKGKEGKGGKGRKKGYRSPAIKDYKEEEKPLHLKCSWVKVPYPITSECMCTC